MKMGFLVLMGLPGSGKTTLARTLKNCFMEYNGTSYYFIHVCYDTLIKFPPPNHDLEWKQMRNEVLVKIDNLIAAIKNQNIEKCPIEFKKQMEDNTYEKSNIIILIDDNMYFKSMRYSLFQIAKKYSISFCQLYLNCSLEQAILKNSLREANSIIPVSTIENMYSKIEPPNCENYWERFSLQVKAYSDINEFCEQLFSVLNDSLTHNEYMKDDDNEERNFSVLQCRTNLLHQADIALRKIVNRKIKELISQNVKLEKNMDIKVHIKNLNNRKAEILVDLKMSNIIVPDELLKELGNDVLEKPQLILFLNSYF